MFKGQSKSSLETLGLIFTIIFIVFIITLIFLTGYDYNETYTRWSDGPFYCIGPLQLSMVVISFVAAVLGGIGSIPGAMIGGLVLGIVEILSKTYISSQLSDAIVFGILVIVLLVKPTGILGKKIQEKV